MGKHIAALFILACASAASAADPSHDKVWGYFSFGVGPSTEPVLWRGEGNPEHYRGTLRLNVRTAHWRFGFTGVCAGAATFDECDRADVLMSVARDVKKNWSVGLMSVTHFAINNPPGHDPKARTRQSAPNAMYVTIERRFKQESFLSSVYGGLRIRGKIPLYSPVAYSEPYATEYVGANFTYPLPKKVVFDARTEAFGNRSFNKMQYLLSPALSRQLAGGRLIVSVESALRFNVGLEPHHMRRPLNEDPKRLTVSITVPFGRPY